MSNLEDYKAAKTQIPGETKRWHLHGAGLDNLREATIATPTFGPDEILVRHDAVGICFSDVKIVNLGPSHPRLYNRDMKKKPVVMGHEVALTVVGVGENRQSQFQIGQRFIVQADVYYQGVNLSYGYALDGGMAQYGVVGKEVLDGDEGCYLLPIDDKTGYAEAALVEPWACVVAAYEFPFRNGLQDDGRLLVININQSVYGDEARVLYPPGHQPASVVTVDNVPNADFTELREAETGGDGFDDIVVYGTPRAEDLGRIAGCLGKRGILNLVSDAPLDSLVSIDIGRVHYEQQLYVGASNPARVLDAYSANTRAEIKPGGAVWFVGAGGPMGQMHIQYAVLLPSPPAKIVVSDNHASRLERIRLRFGPQAAARGIELILVNAKDADPSAHGPFDDIVSMVPNAQLVAQTIPHLADGGVYNIFAGVAKGVMAQIDLSAMLAKNQRLVGTSGSSIADLRHTLDLVQSDALSTDSSVAAIGGLDAFQDGLAAVKESRFPGKTVIYPHVADLPLLALDELQARLPDVYAKLRDGQFWTREAEEELLREKLTL